MKNKTEITADFPETIFDLVYSHADRMYIAVPRRDRNKPREDLWTFDSGQSSGMYACTGIPTIKVLKILSETKNKWDKPLCNLDNWDGTTDTIPQDKIVIFVLKNGTRMLYHADHFTRNREIQKGLGMDYWIDNPSQELIEEVRKESKGKISKFSKFKSWIWN